MSTELAHRPHEVLARVLIARSLAGDPSTWATALATTTAGDAWPAFWAGEPDKPDNCITVYGNTPQVDAKTAPDSALVQHFALTIRVRGRTDDLAGQKAEDVAHDLNETLYDQKVTIGATEYSVPSVRAFVIPLGRQAASSGAMLWFYNVSCLCVILAYPTGR